MVTETSRPQIALALQGGGSHGAYGWGLLERLLEEEIDIVAVSGASAGAMNGAALVAGLATGGRQEALAGLERLWACVGQRSPLKAFDVDWLPGASLLEPWVGASLSLGKLLSPYVSSIIPGVRDMGVLRRIVADTIDLEALSRPSALPFYVAATRVANGTARLFKNDEITLDALMASGCLPEMFEAVRIDGEEYWDGGYSANPALEPLLETESATDLLILQITPFGIDKVGSSLPSMMARISDMGFNACLLRDLKALVGIQSAMRNAPGAVDNLNHLADINLHLVEADPGLVTRGAASKSDTRWSKLLELRALGRAAMEAWLSEHRGELGRRSTLTQDEVKAA